MLIVILIIGVAVSMLLPSLRRSMVLARSAVCMHNLREVGQVLRLYQLENDGWLPGAEPLAVTESGTSPAEEPWFVPLCQTGLDPTSLACPCDPYGAGVSPAPGGVDGPGVGDYASYGLNSLVVYGGGGALADIDRHIPTRPLDTILVADLGPDGGSLTGQVDSGTSAQGGPVPAVSKVSTASVGPARKGSLLSWDDRYDPLAFDVPPTWLTARHGDGVNMLTLAGGVRRARTVDVLGRPVRRYYPDCAAGGCSLCIARQSDQVYHYSFAQDRLYWWTGPVRVE